MSHLKKRRQTVGKSSYVTLSDGTLVRVTAQATMPLASRLVKVRGRSSFRRALVGEPLTARSHARTLSAARRRTPVPPRHFQH